MSSPAFVCPRCRAPLVPGARGELQGLRCTGQHAGQLHPLVDGALPVLVDEPIGWLARSCLDLRELLRANAAWLAELDQEISAASGDAARERLARLRAGERQNRAVLEQLFSLLRQGLTALDVLDASALPPLRSAYSRDLGSALAYARRDFGGRPESEREVAVISAELRRMVEQRGAPAGSALVLGAGVGRVAWDLRARFSRVLAIDSSPLMAGLFQLLSRGPLRFFELNLKNARTPAGQAVAVEAQLPPAPAGTQLDYAIADAAALPVADGSQAAVVSVYFSDVVPLSRLGPEIARVLAPGGLFLHLGPSEYHFAGVEEQVSAEELVQRFAAFGLEPGEPRLVRSSFLQSSARLELSLYDLLAFSAVKRG